MYKNILAGPKATCAARATPLPPTLALPLWRGQRLAPFLALRQKRPLHARRTVYPPMGPAASQHASDHTTLKAGLVASHPQRAHALPPAGPKTLRPPECTHASQSELAVRKGARRDTKSAGDRPTRPRALPIRASRRG